MPDSQYATDLDKNAANHSPLSPLTFLERAAAVYAGAEGMSALVVEDTAIGGQAGTSSHASAPKISPVRRNNRAAIMLTITTRFIATTNGHGMTPPCRIKSTGVTDIVQTGLWHCCKTTC